MFAEAIATFRASYSLGVGTQSGASKGCHFGSRVNGGIFVAFSSDSMVWIDVVSSESRERSGVSSILVVMVESI